MTVAAAFVITFFLALALAIVASPPMIWLGKRFGIVTKMSARRRHEGDQRQLSRLGGGVLFLSFTLSVILAQLLAVPRFDPEEPLRLTGLLLGATVIFITGLLDDWLELKPHWWFLAQFLAAGIAIHHSIFIESFNNPLTGTQTPAWPFAVTAALTLLWIVGMTNTVNFLDGLDGLSHGVVFIAAGVLFLNSAVILEPPQLSVSLLPLALMGATLGFLVHNFYPARIFAGSGAYLLGFLIACLSIIGGAKMATVLMVMALPILDAVWQMINRALAGRSPFRGDRGHAHHRLLDLGYSQRQIVLGYYLFCTGFGTLTLVLESRTFKLVSLVLLSLVIFCGLGVLLWLGRSRAQEVAGNRSPGSGRKDTSS